jgi:hypothetical protein
MASITSKATISSVLLSAAVAAVMIALFVRGKLPAIIANPTATKTAP